MTVGAVVVGTGFGCITHVRALRAAGFDVKAVVGRDPERTAERARQFGVGRALTALDDALGIDGVDAVTIATPPHTHAELALAAIAAGKHVICEKPFARDAAEGRTVLAAAGAAGIVHLLGTEFRWDPGQATLARAVRAGLVGEPRLATVVLHVPMLADPAAEVPEWWADANAGGGWFGAHGSQVIDQLRVTIGEFAGVSAALPRLGASGMGQAQTAGPDIRARRTGDRGPEVVAAMTADDAFAIHFETRSGCAGLLQSTPADWGPIIMVTRIAGTAGTAWIDGVGAKVQVADRDGVRVVPVGADLPTDRPEPLTPGVLHTAYDRMIAHGLDLGPYTCLAAAFRDRILGPPAGASARDAIADDPAPATFADGVAGMAVLDAVRSSAHAGGAWVEVEPEIE